MSAVKSTSHSIVLDHESSLGPSRVVHYPDGRIIVEPPPPRSSPWHALRAAMSQVLGTTLNMSIMFCGAVGAATTYMHLDAARKGNYCVTQRELCTVVGQTVGASLAGTLGGMFIIGPLSAARTLNPLLLRPAAVLAASTSFFMWIMKHRAAAERLLRLLEEGNFSVLQDILNAARDPSFRKQFYGLGGLEVLLTILKDHVNLDSKVLRLLAAALAALAQDKPVQSKLASMNAAQPLVEVLARRDPEVTKHALAALSAFAHHPEVAADLRDVATVSRLVELAKDVYEPQTQAAAVQALAGLAADKDCKAAIGAAGGLHVLMDIAVQPGMLDQYRRDAVSAVHKLVADCPANQDMLAARLKSLRPPHALPHAELEALVRAAGVSAMRTPRSSMTQSRSPSSEL